MLTITMTPEQALVNLTLVKYAQKTWKNDKESNRVLREIETLLDHAVNSTNGTVKGQP